MYTTHTHLLTYAMSSAAPLCAAVIPSSSSSPSVGSTRKCASSSSVSARGRRRNFQKVRATQDLLGFDLNPAALGFLCVMVVWGIPQTLGMSKLDGNEKIAREKMSEWGIDTSTKEGNADYIYKNNYGAVQARFKKECEKRGEKAEDYL